MSKIENAILKQERLGHKVMPLRDQEVGVYGSMAISIAARLLADGKVKEFYNSSCRTRIGNNFDGSWKYGMVFEGRVVLHD